MENSTKDDKNKQCIYEGGEATDFNTVQEWWRSTRIHPLTQQQLGQVVAISPADSSLQEGDPDRLVRKRKNDREYRVRCKEKENRMRCNLETLEKENRELQHENDSLKTENGLVNLMLQTQSKELDQLRNEIENFKLEIRKQTVLVHTVSDLLVSSSDLQNEHQQLLTENLVLRQNWSMNADMLQIVEENARLRLENRIVDAQNKALCGKIVSDLDNDPANHPS
ncbi:hypothetical protein SLE2022_255240 [Rubroshorea leprosula]